MRIILAILLVVSPLTDLDRIAQINKHKKAAKEAYLNEEYDIAAEHYKVLVDSLQVNEEEVILNLANALYKTRDSVRADNLYHDILAYETTDKSKSIASQQLGLMAFNSDKYEPALEHFKNALRFDPTNEDARYNYELLKKLIEEQEQEQQQQQQENEEQDQEQNNEQQNEEKQENQEGEQNEEQEQQEQEQEQEQDQQQEQEQQQDEGEESEEQQSEEQEGEEQQEEPDPSTAEKLEEMNISEEKARMILEAMKNNEIQYIQQNKRKAKNRKKSGKPDW